jgi:hypothetical protein
MVVDFDDRPPGVTAPRLLFQTRIVAPNFVTRRYHGASDGRFLIKFIASGLPLRQSL